MIDARAAPGGARSVLTTEIGGARRDRTDDLKLAKLPLSQLSYGPETHALRGVIVSITSRVTLLFV